MRLRVLILGWGAMLVVIAGLANPVAATAAPAEAAWSLEATSVPTNFEPGTTGTALLPPIYFIVATNIGAAPTNGPFTITDTVPTGVLPKVASGYYGRQRTPLSCAIAFQVVTCTGSGSVQSDELVVVEIAVKVPVGIAGTEVQNSVAVTGGEAVSSRETSLRTSVTTELPQFEFLPGRPGAFVQATTEAGNPSTKAGEHPYQLTVGLGLPTYTAPNDKETLSVGGGPKDIEVVLPPGVVANPRATVKCRQSQLEEPPSPTSGCPLGSQVGLAVPTLGVGLITTHPNPLYNMEAAPGSPAEFAFEILEGIYVRLQGHLRNNGSYVLAASSNDIFAKVPIYGVSTILWGNPDDESHDASRGYCIEPQFETARCPVPAGEDIGKGFVTLPSSCSAPPTAAFKTDSWLEPATAPDSRTVAMSGPDGQPTSIEGCGELAFEPTIALKPDTTAADSPAGLGVELTVPQKEGYEERASATLKGVAVRLPEGYVVNPSAANGRGACDAAQVGLTSAPGQTPAAFSEALPACPDNSKVGQIEIETPLLEKELKGSVYLAAPFENPFGTLLALYIVVDDPETGILLKLAGKVEPDPNTGQLTASFEENPQLPFEEFRLEFFGGPRGTLRTPQVCGTSESTSALTPWSGTAPVSLANQFSVRAGANGAGCVNNQALLPNQPAFSAGTATPVAGEYTPFILHLKREDGSQELSAVDVALPKGLTGKLAGIPYCADSALAAAATRSGRDEQANPSCPVASEVGTVEVGAGAGTQPYYASGKVYLAGPYKGAPLSLAVITPAVAGPFDLGTVVVRAAAYVDLETAQITVKSDPLPTILKGIPLDVRSISFNVSRPGFTLNPTSCEPASIAGTAVSTTSNQAQMSNRFQVGNCGALSFKPNVRISLKGSTKRIGHPALKAEVTYPEHGQYANIARAQVSLPHSEFLDQGNIGNACTKPVLAANGCRASSIYGKAKAWTPLLDKPLEGPVYLVGGYGYKLPALVAELNGQIRILLKGKIDTGKNHGIRNTFEAVPDAPVSKFVLEMKGGRKYGLLENSEDLCRKTQRANARFVAQNGRVVTLRPVIANSCKKHILKGHKKKPRH